MNVNFLDLRSNYESIQSEVEAAVLRSLRSGQYIGGPEVEAFESEYAQFCESEYCVAVANGLEALQLSIVALGIGAGHEVLVPSNTFIATWLAVSHCGATCIPIEPDPATWNIDPRRIEESISDKTRAVIPVHLYGQPAAIDPILAIAERYSLNVIEDAAQAHGARYLGRRIGSHSKLCTWSFYPGKNLGALGDAGAITTNDASLAEKLRLLRNYGSIVRYHHLERGYNSRMDPVQAAILRVKLPYLEGWNERRRAIARRYQEGLASVPNIVVPTVAEGVEPVWHLYCILHPERDRLRVLLQQSGVETLIHYPVPPHRQAAYRDCDFRGRSLEIAENYADHSLSLPIDPMMSDNQVDYVIQAVVQAVKLV
ncbi:erythromycin biosynthesis sensory transduction protein eryC1 [Porphyrobacter algicida]|uniref:Erythromycin biosynthesis sensory transduction protein eryC1 n=1 Tax=Qipengyuania algicida TaxID=1836209 RepID=A0A845ALR6_9SPHN|nr:erythromycin biosynthesis sensory transduction protein eryC1 [Qipengyuania algicida]